MNRIFCLVLALGLVGCARRQDSPGAPLAPGSVLSTKLDVPPQLNSLIVQNETHARALAKKLDLKVAEEIWNYFRAARNGNYPAMIDIFCGLRARNGQYAGSTNDPTVGSPVWQLLLEVELALEQYTNGLPKWATTFGEEVVKTVPRGAIYFGGTDPGRGLPTAFARSHVEDDPVLILSQGPLVGGYYLQYIRYLYGGKIQIPSDELVQQRFQDYLADAQKRLQHDTEFPDEPHQIKPGEDVKVVDDHVQVSGQVSIFAINSLIARDIFDKNPEREFYLEESFPIDWMYPHLTPHGPIFKVNRTALPALPPEIVAKDREYWNKQQAAMIGPWLTIETSVKEVCDFVEKVFLKRDLTGFQGDPAFVRSVSATRLYSYLRSSIAGLYNWRLGESKGPDEQQRMIKEADLAFRQSFAFCPTSPDAIFRYVNLLVQLQRIDDALLIARTAERLNPKDPQLLNLITELERIRNTQPK